MIAFLLAIVVVSVLSAGFLLLLKKLGLLSPTLFLLFGIALCVHLGAALFIHYAEFYPFGGGQGDQSLYHGSATTIAVDFQQGVFSAERIGQVLSSYRMQHWYPVLIGVLYAITIPALIIGKMMSVWFVCVAVVLIFLISRELGISEKGAFGAGLIGVAYPSMLYFGSLLLREGAVAVAVLLAFLLLLKLIKTFSWRNFVFLYVVLLALVHLRFYVGFIVLFVMAFSLAVCQKIPWKKRVIQTVVAILFLGCIPQVFGYGYYGVEKFAPFLHLDKIKLYREIAYIAPAVLQPEQKKEEAIQPKEEVAQPEVVAEPVAEALPQAPPAGVTSTVVVRVNTENPLLFMKQNLISFAHVAFGPFPWHIKNGRQLVVLGETIPWLVCFLLAAVGVWSAFRKTWRMLIPLMLAAFCLLAMVGLFIDNFGVYMRIRMPAFMLLFTLVPLGFSVIERIKKQLAI